MMGLWHIGHKAGIGSTYDAGSVLLAVALTTCSNRVSARSVQFQHPAILDSARNKVCRDTAINKPAICFPFREGEYFRVYTCLNGSQVVPRLAKSRNTNSLH